MQKPPTDELLALTQEFTKKHFKDAPEPYPDRIQNQLFRMLDDLPEEDWDKQPDIELERVCELMTSQIIEFFVAAKRVENMLSQFGLEIPETWGLLPSEQYPDRNFYEIVEEVIAQGSKGKSGDSPSKSPVDLSGLDFSGGFSA